MTVQNNAASDRAKKVWLYPTVVILVANDGTELPSKCLSLICIALEHCTSQAPKVTVHCTPHPPPVVGFTLLNVIFQLQSISFLNKTRRMAIANGTCGSYCNQPKAYFGHPWVRPSDNRGKCHMNEKRIQCLSNASQHAYPSIFNRFPVIQPVSSNVRHFSTFLHILASWVRIWENRGKCYMDGKRIQCWSNA